MTDAKLFVEGGGDSKELQARCREGFKKLLENSGFAGRRWCYSSFVGTRKTKLS